MNTAEYLTAVVDQTRVLAGWVQGRDAELPVPTAPKWSLADLVDHVGATQRMVAMLVGERMDDPSSAYARYLPAPSDPRQWEGYLTEGADAARQAFAGVTDDTPVWDPSGADAGIPFWSRRLFGEISVHRADAAATLDQRYEVAPDRAVAAIEDWLDTLTSAGYWENRPGFADAMRGTGQTLHFHADDAAGDWLARREQDRVALDRTSGPADVTVTGPAADLLLVISRRRPAADSELRIEGDRALFELWIEHMDWVTD